jgi:hypothetical protein
MTYGEMDLDVVNTVVKFSEMSPNFLDSLG